MRKNKQNKIPLIINCDTGIDDAVAIMMAEKNPAVDIKLIVTDVGNVDPKQAAKNTENILELVGAADLPVVAGTGKCFKKERPRVAVHGTNGMGDYMFEANSRRIIEDDAIEVMYRMLMDSPVQMTIVSLSPVTNIARLIEKHNDVLDKIERVVFMAGTIEEVKANEMPYPEFNVAVDPEAAEFVFKSGVRFQIVPMEMGHTAYLTWEEVFKTKMENFTGSVYEYIFRSYKDRHVKNGIAMHDGCAIAYITNPELFEIAPVYAEVKYFDSIKSGVLTMDFKKRANTITCTKINIPAFKKLYFKSLKKCR